MRVNLLLSILMLFLFISCDKDDDPVADDPMLTVSPNKVNFDAKSGSAIIKVTMNGRSWTATANEDWCTVSISSSSESTDQLTVSVTENKESEDRTAEITFSMDGKLKKIVTVSQAGQEPATQGVYPEYGNHIEPDATGMNSNAVQLAAKIKLGFNIGNTLEAIGGETAWGNPKITKEFVDAVKSYGFNAIRLPASWNQYSDPETAAIDQDWLDRVKEVVQYCVDNEMYVLLNIHWDGGWLEENITPEKQEQVNAKQKAFWQQIATHLRDFDEHLMFASANEPNVHDATQSTQMPVLNSYHQTFIDAVRATGGRNSYRVLVVQGPSTDIDRTNNFMKTLPTDEIEDRMMVEVHTYTPYPFALMEKDEDWGNMFYYWGDGNHSEIEPDRNATWGEEDFLIEQFETLKSNFVDKGIPVLLGEYLAIHRTNVADPEMHNASRLHWIKFVTQIAIENGVLPFVWDTGGIIDRSNNNVKDQEALDALLEGANL